MEQEANPNITPGTPCQVKEEIIENPPTTTQNNNQDKGLKRKVKEETVSPPLPQYPQYVPTPPQYYYNGVPIPQEVPQYAYPTTYNCPPPVYYAQPNYVEQIPIAATPLPEQVYTPVNQPVINNHYNYQFYPNYWPHDQYIPFAPIPTYTPIQQQEFTLAPIKTENTNRIEEIVAMPANQNIQPLTPSASDVKFPELTQIASDDLSKHTPEQLQQLMSTTMKAYTEKVKSGESESKSAAELKPLIEILIGQLKGIINQQNSNENSGIQQNNQSLEFQPHVPALVPPQDNSAFNQIALPTAFIQPPLPPPPIINSVPVTTSSPSFTSTSRQSMISFTNTTKRVYDAIETQSSEQNHCKSACNSGGSGDNKTKTKCNHCEHGEDIVKSRELTYLSLLKLKEQEDERHRKLDEEIELQNRLFLLVLQSELQRKCNSNPGPSQMQQPAQSTEPQRKFCSEVKSPKVQTSKKNKGGKKKNK